ncbi:NlpC/P60 family protein [Couchioplanes caeruleus]|uniref:C40 family peptidase n=1 Tax=Couchioplanes caeruleus TaxID=56438 RepID=UPI0020C0B8B9|nr:C40 family peptidase [Couchioplanes caeruleus]UQU64709.1 NlpC/P60 family protein [Couchioplanes caeruleus]
MRVRPWWRPLAYSAATAAAIAALFNPLPAGASPVAPGAPVAPAVPVAPALPVAPAAPGSVPDAGSRPVAIGSITLPGQRSTTPTTPPTSSIIGAGAPTNPIMRKIEAGRAAVAAMGEQLAKLDEDLNLTRTQLSTADQKVTQTQTAVTAAQQEVTAAAAASVRNAAALPPGSFGSGLQDLDSLARIQRGDSATEQAAGRQLTIVQSAYAAAVAEQQNLRTTFDRLTIERTAKKTALDKKTAAQQKYEQQHADVIAASDAAEAVQDAQAGAGFLAGENAGRGADPRAIAALRIALAQRGDPYVWSEEGPDWFDCSGLMYYAYRSDAAGNFPLTRVSKDQYYQTRGKTVDRYSLLPGDLLFFSSSTSWTGIHHVAMYAGDGMMVEAPRTGLNVRLVPVRWTRLFAATRIYGSVEGTVEGPHLGSPDPETPSNHTPTTSPTPRPSSKPPTKPTTPGSPSTSPSKPSTSPSKPSTPPSSPSTSPGTPSTSPSTEPKPTTTPPTTSAPPSAAPSKSQDTSPSGSADSSDGTKSPTASATSSKTTAPAPTTTSKPATPKTSTSTTAKSSASAKTSASTSSSATAK